MTNFTSLRSFTQSSITSSPCQLQQLWKLQGACISFASWFVLSGWTVELNPICERLSQQLSRKKHVWTFEIAAATITTNTKKCSHASYEKTHHPTCPSHPSALTTFCLVNNWKIEGNHCDSRFEAWNKGLLFPTSFHPPSFCCVTCRTWAASAPLDEACVDQEVAGTMHLPAIWSSAL